jgi:aldehyde:ferredoxin oxidoreductase
MDKRDGCSTLRWFKEPLTKGPMKGSKLDAVKYYAMLQDYYRKRGWDQRGIPKKVTLDKLGISNVAKELKKYVELS